ncbi:MAG: tetratricopeptide repeat protein [Candidatus Cloacimonetes bacterium]|nr:tetratricopeptide repeat protein [Candidatus Cloacimonadota bacterium]
MIEFWNNYKEKYFRKKGQKLLAKGNFEKAYLIFQKALIINTSVENRFNLGITLLSLNKYSQAEKILKEIYDIYPENELNLLGLSECVIMQKKWDEAIEFYQKTTELFPRNKAYQKYLLIAKDAVAREKYVKAQELFKQATKALKQKNDKQALNILLQASEYFPEDPTILNNIASLFIMLKDYQKAYNYAKKAVSIKPSDSRYQNNLKIAKRKLKKQI